MDEGAAARRDRERPLGLVQGKRNRLFIERRVERIRRCVSCFVWWGG